MNDNSNCWVIVPKESWREVVAELRDRLDELREPSSETFAAIEKFGPQKTWPIEGDNDGIFVAVNLIIYGTSSFFTATQVMQHVLILWEAGQFVVVPLNTRFLVEIWGGVHFARTILEDLLCGKDIEGVKASQERISSRSVELNTSPNNALPLGKKSQVYLCFGLLAQAKTQVISSLSAKTNSNIDKDAFKMHNNTY